jgi:glycosyltransferase involved in cell wall biosynthesis
MSESHTQASEAPLSGHRPPPLVSVVMANRNGEEFLGQAIESILNQTFHDFELLIIESSTTDKSFQIERRFTDPRIKVVPYYEKRGMPQALNRGIELATGKYIARMDADDISLPERLEKEVRLLESNPGVSLVHTGCLTIDSCGKVKSSLENYNRILSILWPADDNDLWAMLRWNFVAHGSVMVRTSILKANRYDETEDGRGEDWDLWVRLIKYHRFAKIDEPLYEYRMHDSQSVNGLNYVPIVLGLIYTMTRWLKRDDLNRREKLRVFGSILVFLSVIPLKVIKTMMEDLRRDPRGHTRVQRG